MTTTTPCGGGRRRHHGGGDIANLTRKTRGSGRRPLHLYRKEVGGARRDDVGGVEDTRREHQSRAASSFCRRLHGQFWGDDRGVPLHYGSGKRNSSLA